MDRIVELSKLKQDGGKPKVDQAKIDGLAADLAAAIKGTYMLKGGRELEDKEPGQKLTIESSLSNQDVSKGPLNF